MMKPRKVSFYVYADTEEEIAGLQEALFDFVSDKYSEGILVTADRLTMALRKFEDNFMVKQFLRI